ncbi:MAG: phytoene/squalene synthase family protein [Flavobacteriales bacterium]|nr:phytoene/squalene synthase family protein [Flavobacteriales bacterium]
MKALFDQVSESCSKLTTRSYSTSFSLGILFLDNKFRTPIYNIYGFVRFADEIVDSFHDFDKESLLARFREDTVHAIEYGISLNPILNSFQKVVREYGIEWELIDTFLRSMEMDLDKDSYDRLNYEQYILGSAEVVGLMCLRVFAEGDDELYQSLKPAAMRLGAAFQKVNFLRDLNADFKQLGRTYFPSVDPEKFDYSDKTRIEEEIEADFSFALEGIRKLPAASRRGVYLAYYYYLRLFNKIKSVPANRVLEERIRIPNSHKMVLMLKSLVRHQLNAL